MYIGFSNISRGPFKCSKPRKSLVWLGFAAVENVVGNFSVYSDFNSVFCLQRDHTSKIPYKPYKLKNFFEKFNFEHENFFLEQSVCSCFFGAVSP